MIEVRWRGNFGNAEHWLLHADAFGPIPINDTAHWKVTQAVTLSRSPMGLLGG